MNKDHLIFVKHILENIEDIETFSKGISKDEFSKNKLKQKAIIRSLEVIGEAVKNIPDLSRGKYPDVEWKAISGLRDKLIHHYFGVDLNAVWNIINKDIPDLKEKIRKILNQE